MTRLYIFTFYILFLYLLFDRAKILMSRERVENFLNLSSSETSTVLLFLILITLVLTLATSIYPKKTMRVFVAIFMSSILYVYYWGSHISHTYHAWAMCLYLLCLLNSDEDLNKGYNLSIIRLVQSLLLSHYFIGGLWKVRALTSFDSLSSLVDYPLGLVASTLAEGQWISPVVVELIKNQSGIVFLGWVVMVGFQLSTIIPIVKGRWYMAWGLLAIGFHFIGGLFLGVWFSQTVLALLFFFIITEGLLVYMESKNLNFRLVSKS